MSSDQQQPPVYYNYSIKIEADQKCRKTSIHYYHKLDNDITFDIANQITVDAYNDLNKRLEKDGLPVAPLVEKE